MPCRAAWSAALVLLAAPGLCAATESHCGVDSVSACTCLMSVSVYDEVDGCSAQECETVQTSVKDYVGGCVAQAKHLQKQCEEMQTLVKCATDMGCFDAVVKEACTNMTTTDPDCSLDCGGAPRAVGVGLALLAAVVGLCA